MDTSHSTQEITEAEIKLIQDMVRATFDRMRQMVHRWTTAGPTQQPTQAALVSITMASEIHRLYNCPAPAIEDIVRQEDRKPS